MRASLPMYDFPELRRATDAWWQAIAQSLRREGLSQVPARLTRAADAESTWQAVDLLLTQTCGYPLRHEMAGILTALAAPSYDAQGCGPGEYSSAIIVREDESAGTLADLRGRCLVANAADSQSGFNCMRDAVIGSGYSTPFFNRMVWSGSHRRSLAAIRRGEADIAAIDAVSLALVQANAADEVIGLRVLDWTVRVPALPYATRANAEKDTIARLRAGLHNAAASSGVAAARSALLIKGFVDIDDAGYEPIVAMRQRAEASGCVDLAAS